MNLNKITLSNSIPFQRKCISEVNKLIFVIKINRNAKKKRDLDRLEQSHQKRKHVISFPRTLIRFRHFDTDFIFSTDLY